MAERDNPKILYFVEKERVSTSLFRDGQHCIEKKVSKKNVFFSPMEPQPEISQILEVHRVYTVLKASKEYKRRVTWFANIPSSLQFLLNNVALAEYLGTCPIRVFHGNTKHAVDGQEGYVRTKQAVLKKIADRVRDKTPKKQIGWLVVLGLTAL